MRILVIDDEPLFLRAQVHALRAHDVSTAASAAAAFEHIARVPFDVILCDLHMPGVDGPALLARLDPVDAERMIFISGGAYAPGDEEFLAGHRSLMKPYRVSELEEEMKSVGSRGGAAPPLAAASGRRA